MAYTFTVSEPATLNNRFELQLSGEGGISEIDDLRIDDLRLGDALYDLQGRKIGNGQLHRGLYLQGGKKYIHY